MAIKRAYQLGVTAAFQKVGLLSPPDKRIYYKGIPRTSPMVGEAADGNYDSLLARLRDNTTDDAFHLFDSKPGADDGRTDLFPTAP